MSYHSQLEEVASIYSDIFSVKLTIFRHFHELNQ